MKLTRFIAIQVLILISAQLFANEDMLVSRKFGNTMVTINTAYEYEEVDKVFIWGQLAEKLSKELKFTKQINLFFNHSYVKDSNPDYFITCKKIRHKKGSIYIEVFARQFNIEKCLKLLEFGILNRENIKSSQKEIDYHKNYYNIKIKSIDSTIIKTTLDKPSSKQVLKILELRVDRPDKNFYYGISYYFKENKFTFFLRELNGSYKEKLKKSDTDLISFSNVYYMPKLENLSVIVFDTDSSFYYIDQYNKPIISKKQIIHDIHTNYKPYKVNDIGGGKFSIYFDYLLDTKYEWNYKPRNMIYLVKKDTLIQDLDKLIDLKNTLTTKEKK